MELVKRVRAIPEKTNLGRLRDGLLKFGGGGVELFQFGVSGCQKKSQLVTPHPTPIPFFCKMGGANKNGWSK